MASIDMDALGDEQKRFEQAFAGEKIMPGIPVLARLDGRSFHSFTKGLSRPFSEKLISSIQETTKVLVEEFKPTVAYTQSDEITLCWLNEETQETKLMFGGKIQKLTSVMAATASVHFNYFVHTLIGPEYSVKRPTFDCRVWQVPTPQVAAENFLWREMDASKNSVSMAASAYFSPKELDGKSTKERKAMLYGKGVTWARYPASFRKGTYFRRVTTERYLTPSELAAIPEEHRPKGPVVRSGVNALKPWPKATAITNLAQVLFYGEEPIIDDHAITREE